MAKSKQAKVSDKNPKLDVVQKENISSDNPSFVFIGNGRDDPKSLTLYGHTFELDGEPVEVSDATAIRILSNHSHFKRG